MDFLEGYSTFAQFNFWQNLIILPCSGTLFNGKDIFAISYAYIAFHVSSYFIINFYRKKTIARSPLNFIMKSNSLLKAPYLHILSQAFLSRFVCCLHAFSYRKKYRLKFVCETIVAAKVWESRGESFILFIFPSWMNNKGKSNLKTTLNETYRVTAYVP